MKSADRREPPIETDDTAQLTPMNATAWRDLLTPVERAIVEQARRHVTLWQGAANNGQLMVVDKLARLLDGEHG